MEVREEHLEKHSYPKLVTLYVTSSYVTPSGMVTSVAVPLYFDNSAVFVSVSKLYLKSPSVYLMVSAFIAKPMAAKREMSMNLKVNILFI